MVEYTDSLDAIFQSLADATRRDILRRLSTSEQTVSQLATPYAMSLAAVAKHIDVLEQAGLVTKRRHGKARVVSIAPEAIKTAETHLSQYQQLWSAPVETPEARDGLKRATE